MMDFGSPCKKIGHPSSRHVVRAEPKPPFVTIHRCADSPCNKPPPPSLLQSTSLTIYPARASQPDTDKPSRTLDAGRLQAADKCRRPTAPSRRRPHQPATSRGCLRPGPCLPWVPSSRAPQLASSPPCSRCRATTPRRKTQQSFVKRSSWGRWGAAQKSDSRPRVALVTMLILQNSNRFPRAERLGTQVKQMEGEKDVSSAEGRPVCAPSTIFTVCIHACPMGE